MKRYSKNNLFLEKNWLEKFIFINRVIFIFLIPITYIFLILETFTYKGFTQKYLLVDLKYLIIVSIISTSLNLFSNILRKKQKTNLLLRVIDYIFKINKLLSPFVFVIYYTFQFLDAVNYPNYVFSRYHIQPQNLFYVMIFNLYLLAISELSRTEWLKHHFLSNKDKLSENYVLRPKGLITILIYGFLGIYLITNITQVFNIVIKSSAYTITHVDDNYDNKMRAKWGFFYDYLVFVRENTPEDAVIHLPPKVDPWQRVGNAGLVRYFLYPRTLISTKDPSILLADKCDYILVSKGFSNQTGEWGYGWPKVSVEADWIMYINSDTRETETIYENYDPNNSKDWGLIKIYKDI